MSRNNAVSGNDTPMTLAGIDFSNVSDDDLIALLHQVLERRFHGISFSPYIDGQGPGTQISEAQIRERLSVIQPHVDWVRSSSCTEENEAIPRIARENGLKTMVGA